MATSTRKKSSARKTTSKRSTGPAISAADRQMMEAGQGSQEQALALFDRLPIVEREFMYGRWRGFGLHTDHAMDGLLENYDWYGKEFIGPDEVHPLVFSSGNSGRTYRVNPALMPIGLALHMPFLKRPIMRYFFKLGKPLFSTKKTGARLRMTEHRGKSSATMCYDALPIHDVFRKFDENTLLGLMDMKGMEQPFFFILRRVI